MQFFGGVSIIRVTVFRGLYWGPSFREATKKPGCMAVRYGHRGLMSQSTITSQLDELNGDQRVQVVLSHFLTSHIGSIVKMVSPNFPYHPDPYMDFRS